MYVKFLKTLFLCVFFVLVIGGAAIYSFSKKNFFIENLDVGADKKFALGVDYGIFPDGAEFGRENVAVIDQDGNFDTEGVLTVGDLYVGGMAYVSSLNLSDYLYVAGNQIVDDSGRIPALTVDYIAELDGTSITGVNADKLDGIDSSGFIQTGTSINANTLDYIDSTSFLRSDASGTAGGAINFTAAPGSANVGGGPIYVNPSSSAANYTLLGVAVNGTEKFRVDADGDASVAGSLTLSGSLALSSLTSGSIGFFNSTGILSQDNSNFYWDDSNNRLGLGTNNPAKLLDVRGGAVFNTDGGDYDLNIKGDTDANLFYVDASEDRVGIGTSVPGATLEINSDTENNLGVIIQTTDDNTTNNLFEVHNSSGSTLFYISSQGKLIADLGTSAGFFIGGGGNSTVSGVGSNVAVGTALTSLTTGHSNIGVGALTLRDETTGYYNIAVGGSTLRQGTGNTSNVAVGHGALMYITSSAGNIAFGFEAGRRDVALNNNTKLTNSIFIGNSTTSNASNDSNEIVIGNSATGIGSNSVVLGNDSVLTTALKGEVGIGITSPNATLHVLASGTGDIAIFNSENNTGCTLSEGGVISCSSDINLKKDIISLSDNDSLDLLMKLRPVSYRWNSQDSSRDPLSYGFIAQEVRQIIPELVRTDNLGYQNLNTVGFIPFLTKAIQEQQLIIDDLENNLAQDSLPEFVFNYESETLTVNSIVKALKEFVAEGIATFKKNVEFLADVTFKGKVRFNQEAILADRLIYENKDVAGYAVIKSGGNKVRVEFEKEHSDTPLVQVTPYGLYDVEYAVIDTSPKGFTIMIEPTATEDTSFSWMVLAVKDARTHEGSEIVPTEIVETSEMGTEAMSPTSEPVALPSLTPEPDELDLSGVNE